MLEMSPLPFYFRTIYYSDFWYSRFFRFGAEGFSGNLISDEIDQHKIRLRLLSLFFDHIYIPRTHLITEAFPDQHKISDRMMDSYEIGLALDTGSLRVSSFPGLDALEDSLRILERQTETSDAFYPSDEKYVRKIPVTREFVVNTMKESRGNEMTFPEYGRILKAMNPKVGEAFLDIVGQANLRNVPFFHESFVRKLRQEMSDETFFPIWRNTNSIYLTTGAREHSSFIAYFNEDIEHVSFRFAPYGVDRYLFSPASLYTFLNISLNSLQISRFLFDDLRVTHRPLLDDGMRNIIAGFRREYQKIVWDVSRVIKFGRLSSEFDQRAIKALFELCLDDGLSKLTAIVEEAADEAQRAGSAAGGIGGFVASLLQTAAKYGGRTVKSRHRRKRFPHIFQVLDRLSSVTSSRG